MTQAPSRQVMVTIEWPGRDEDGKLWLAATEVLSIDLTSLQEGALVETMATFPGFSEPTRYVGKCIAFGLANGRFDLILDFQREGNEHLVEDQDIRYGQNTIQFDEALSSASAEFKPTKADLLLATSCKVVEVSLLSKLTRAQVTVLLRPDQNKVRKALLAEQPPFSCCAVSGESLEEALELAHVIAHSDQGACGSNNAFLLRADLHAMFDAGKLQISSDDGSISLSDVPLESGYHAQCEGWARKIPDAVFERVKGALGERQRAALSQ